MREIVGRPCCCDRSSLCRREVRSDSRCYRPGAHPGSTSTWYSFTNPPRKPLLPHPEQIRAQTSGASPEPIVIQRAKSKVSGRMASGSGVGTAVQTEAPDKKRSLTRMAPTKFGRTGDAVMPLKIRRDRFRGFILNSRTPLFRAGALALLPIKQELLRRLEK